MVAFVHILQRTLYFCQEQQQPFLPQHLTIALKMLSDMEDLQSQNACCHIQIFFQIPHLQLSNADRITISG